MDGDSLIAVLSDVHGNHFALRECIRDAARLAERNKLPIEFWFLGDVANGLSGVAECLEQLCQLGDSLTGLLLGNHDRAQLLWWLESEASALLPLTDDNRRAVAQAAARYIRDQSERELLAEDVHSLTYFGESQRDFWSRWKDAPAWAPAQRFPGVFLAHGLIVNANPRHHANTTASLLDEGATDRLNLMVNLLMADKKPYPRLVVHGHTHVADTWRRSPNQQWEHPSPAILQGSDVSWSPLDADSLWVINVGSVGMQRDRQPGCAVYGLLSASEAHVVGFALRRVPFDLANALKHYRSQGAPSWLLTRLEQGF